MSSWRDAILNDFIPNVNKLTLVADPDCLLTEEKLALEIRKRGFDLIEFNDPVEFRYVYESKYRSIWDRDESTDLSVAIRLQGTELESLPYDLLKAGRKLSFNLGGLFPSLSYSVIEKINRSLFDALFEAQHNKSPPAPMGDNATKDFILSNAFGIDLGSIRSEVDLLHALLRLHYGKLQIPSILVERLTHVLESHNGFKAWPISEIISDDKIFFDFLQERWPLFLSGLGNADQIQEDSSGYGLKYPGPSHLPLDHQDIKIYIYNLFLEGKLTPVEVTDIEVDAGSWIRSGIALTDLDDDSRRVSRLFDLIENELPTVEARYSDWTTFALKWAELSALVHCGSRDEYQNRLKITGDTLNTTFAEWLTNHYSSLINLPPTNPVMVHHVPRRLARDIEESSNSRAALIVVDGLALDQWVTIRQILQKQDANLIMRESAIFAWIPTMTSVSRQAIFSGDKPSNFVSSIHTTGSEKKLWEQFWEDHGLSQLEVAYQRWSGTGDVSSALDFAIYPDKTKVIGLVVGMVDKIMHGMHLGSAGLHNQIKQWCQNRFLATLISQLLEHGYKVWLTSDHGNIQCDGIGRPSESVIAKTRGERVRVYSTPELRSRVADNFSFTYEWFPVGLPDNYFPLIVGGRDAFVNSGKTVVSHGGVAIEEVIVPLVKFERRVNS